MRVDKVATSASVKPLKSLVCTKCTFNNHQELLVEHFRPQKCAVCESLLQDGSRSVSAIENGHGLAEAREVRTTSPSRVKSLGVRPIHEADRAILVCPRCSSVSTIHEATHCQACRASLEAQSSGLKTCASCTLVNKPGAIVCDACETMLEDPNDVFEALGSGIATSAAGNTRWTRGHPRMSDGGLRASSAVGTVAELTARTVEDGGDTHSISADLVPWLHERLLHQYGKYRRGGASGDVRGGISESTPARRSWAEGSTSGERASPNTLILNGGATAERPRTAEWILCHPSTAHCTQRGAPGSKFSCGYRNIQMLCSALLHFPEYKRSFGIRAQVVDFEVQGSPGGHPRPSSRVGEREQEGVRHDQPAKKRKSLAPTDTTEAPASEGRASPGKQTSILDFLSRGPGEESIRRRRGDGDVRVSTADGPDMTTDHKCSRDLGGSGVSSDVEGAQDTDDAESTTKATHFKATLHSQRARGAIPWSGTEDEVAGHGLEPKRQHRDPGARSKCSPAREDSNDARGGRLGKGKPRKGRPKGEATAQDKPGVGCGKAVTEWALEYFRTPWREERSSHAAGSRYGVLRAREDEDARRERSAEFEEGRVHESDQGLPYAPPPLYLQHDGHSRTVVGVLWSEQKNLKNLKKGSAPVGSRQQPGTLLIFDPSHKGSEIRDALMDYGSLRWCSLLKRGECSLRRRQFQVVAVRPGLIKPEHAHEWKKIVSVKIRIGFD